MGKPINENPNPAPRCNAPAIQIHLASVTGALDHLRSERDAALARAERAEAALPAMTASRDRLAAECRAWRFADEAEPDEYADPNSEMWAAYQAVNAARAAVDAAGDLAKGGAA